MSDRGAPFSFPCEKQPARAARGMVVTNHPLASLAGTEVLLAGGNAIDAAVASLFALSVVEPMMVGPMGGGMAHIRLGDGTHRVLDGLSTAPASATPDMYEALPGHLPGDLETTDRRNALGAAAVAVPGALAGWCEAAARFGRLPLADLVAPAIRLAEGGFAATPYLADCVADCAADLARDPGLAALFLPDGAAIKAGDRVVWPDLGQSLRLIAKEGAAALHGGSLGAAVAETLQAGGGVMTAGDLADYATVTREPVRGRYRDFEIVGPPPPASGGVHVIQMLNILEGFDIRGLGFGTAASTHLLAEVLKIAYADRAVATADPAFVNVPVTRLTSKAYAAERRGRMRLDRAQSWSAGLARGESPNTTHVTVADADGNVVSSTQTINALFGARLMVPGTGLIANNYMYNFDPRPGGPLSIAPGKRVFTSQAPVMALQGGRVRYALGLPGALRIFGSAMQALVNLIDHGMDVQQAVEAPRIWTQGAALEVEAPLAKAIGDALAALGHEVLPVARVAGGMNAIAFDDDGMMTGAACWRADGTPIGIGGGLARAGVRFTTL